MVLRTQKLAEKEIKAINGDKSSNSNRNHPNQIFATLTLANGAHEKRHKHELKRSKAHLEPNVPPSAYWWEQCVKCVLLQIFTVTKVIATREKKKYHHHFHVVKNGCTGIDFTKRKNEKTETNVRSRTNSDFRKTC